MFMLASKVFPLLSKGTLPISSVPLINFRNFAASANPIQGTPTSLEWAPDSKRTGLLAIKEGMMSLWNEFGVRIPVTVLKINNCNVTYVKTKENEGYDAIQVGCSDQKHHRVTKPLLHHFEKAGVEPKRKVVEFLITPDARIPIGTPLTAAHFVPGQFIDVAGKSIGKGFQGPMKRWNFGGMNASHGVSLTHRSHGSTGQNTSPGRVFKGKKMAGNMGNENIYVKNLKIIKIDTKLNLLYVKGAVPGHKGQFIKVRDAQCHRKLFPEGLFPPFPTFTAGKGDNIPREAIVKAKKDVLLN